MKTSDGDLVLAVGASRSGKTAWVSQQIAKSRRVLIWDVEGQYVGKGFQPVSGRRQLIDMIMRIGKGPARLAYVPHSLAEFGYWADVAFLWARVGQADIVAEELADVTTPGKAPAEWGILCRRGLKYGTNIYAITQRPAESDKTAVGNATVIHCCRLQRAADRKYMAAEMDVDVKEIAGLRSDQAAGVFEYLHKDMRANNLEKGRLRF